MGDEYGHHNKNAAEQLGHSAITHILSLDLVATEHRCASAQADLRLRTSTEMYQGASGMRYQTRLQLSQEPAAGLQLPA